MKLLSYTYVISDIKHIKSSFHVNPLRIKELTGLKTLITLNYVAIFIWPIIVLKLVVDCELRFAREFCLSSGDPEVDWCYITYSNICFDRQYHRSYQMVFTRYSELVDVTNSHGIWVCKFLFIVQRVFRHI